MLVSYRVAALLILLSPPAFSVVAQNNVGTPDRQAGASFSGSFSVTAGPSNLVALAAITWNGDGQTGTAAATYGGNAMTSCGAKSTAGTSGGAGMQWFYLVNPPTGSNTLAITISGGTPGVTEIYANLVSYSGVDQATPVRPGSYFATVSSAAAGTTFTSAINSNASDLTVSAMSDDTGLVGTNQTQDWSNTTGVMEQYGDHSTTPASSVTDTWTFIAGGANFVWVGFSLQAAAAASGTVCPAPFCGVIGGM